MDFNVLFIHPLDEGLKAFIKVDDKIYFITFQTTKNKAEFTVYSEDEKDKVLIDNEFRQELLNRFILFLKQSKEEIKVGVYFNPSEEMFGKIFELTTIKKLGNGLIDATFSILNDSFTISNIRAIKNKHDIYFDINNSSFKHHNKECFCENIKHNHDLNNFEHCLILIEHQDLILDWLLIQYKQKFMSKKSTKIIQFPK